MKESAPAFCIKIVAPIPSSTVTKASFIFHFIFLGHGLVSLLGIQSAMCVCLHCACVRAWVPSLFTFCSNMAEWYKVEYATIRGECDMQNRWEAASRRAKHLPEEHIISLRSKAIIFKLGNKLKWQKQEGVASKHSLAPSPFGFPTKTFALYRMHWCQNRRWIKGDQSAVSECSDLKKHHRESWRFIKSWFRRETSKRLAANCLRSCKPNKRWWKIHLVRVMLNQNDCQILLD